MSKYQTWELTPDEVISGLLVSASTLTLTIAVGVARVGGVLREQTASSTLTATANTTQYVYINPATDYDGNSLTKISFTKEPDHTHTNLIGGTVGTRKSRSVMLAKVTTTANAGTVTLAQTWAANDILRITVDSINHDTTAVGATKSVLAAAAAVTMNTAAAARAVAAAAAYSAFTVAAVATLAAVIGSVTTLAAVTTAIAVARADQDANQTGVEAAITAARVYATASGDVVTVTALVAGGAFTMATTGSTIAGNGTATATGTLTGATSTVDNSARDNFGAFIGMRSEMGE